MARAGLHVRRLQPRRVRPSLDRRVRLRRRCVHARCRGVEVTRRGAAGDLAPLSPGPDLRGARLVDPRPDADASSLHRPPLAPRNAGAPAVEPRLVGTPAPRRLGEHARECSPRSAARHAPRPLRARTNARTLGNAKHRADRPRPARDLRHSLQPDRRSLATTTYCFSIHRSRARSRSGSGPRPPRTPPRSTCSWQWRFRSSSGVAGG